MTPAWKLITYLPLLLVGFCTIVLFCAASCVASPMTTTRWHSLLKSSLTAGSKKSEGKPVTDALLLRNSGASQTPFSVTSASADAGCFIYTNLGESFQHQPYIWESISQTRLFNPHIRIYLISTADAFAEAGVQDRVQTLHVNAVDYASLVHLALDQFRNAFFIQGEMSPGGNTKFTQYTSERLLAVYVLMETFDLTDVFHVENDNLVYFAAETVLHAMNVCDVQFAVPFVSVRLAVVGCAFFRNSDALLPFVEFATNVFLMGRDKAVEYLGTEWVNDMSLLGMFYKENTMSRNVTELPSRVYSSRHLYSTNMSSEEYFLRPIAFQEGHLHSCIAEALPDSIFDSCAIGQYFGGTYGNPEEPFWQSDRQLDPRGMTLWWKQVIHSGIQFRLPYLDNLQIHNLHIHSKQLSRFMSMI